MNSLFSGGILNVHNVASDGTSVLLHSQRRNFSNCFAVRSPTPLAHTNFKATVSKIHEETGSLCREDSPSFHSQPNFSFCWGKRLGFCTKKSLSETWLDREATSIPERDLTSLQMVAGVGSVWVTEARPRLLQWNRGTAHCIHILAQLSKESSYPVCL